MNTATRTVTRRPATEVIKGDRITFGTIWLTVAIAKRDHNGDVWLDTVDHNGCTACNKWAPTAMLVVSR